jgi:hypothetical protein
MRVLCLFQDLISPRFRKSVQVARSTAADSYTAMISMACNSSRWNAANQSKDWRIRRRIQLRPGIIHYSNKLFLLVLSNVLCKFIAGNIVMFPVHSAKSFNNIWVCFVCPHCTATKLRLWTCVSVGFSGVIYSISMHYATFKIMY